MKLSIRAASGPWTMRPGSRVAEGDATVVGALSAMGRMSAATMSDHLFKFWILRCDERSDSGWRKRMARKVGTIHLHLGEVADIVRTRATGLQVAVRFLRGRSA